MLFRSNFTGATSVKLTPDKVTTGVVPEQADVGVKLVIAGTVTQLTIASQPEETILPSDLNTKVNEPSVAVETIVPGDVVPR